MLGVQNARKASDGEKRDGKRMVAMANEDDDELND